MSPELKARLANLTADFERGLSRIAEYDKSESEMNDMTLDEIKYHFESLHLRIMEMDRVMANLKATVAEDWS